jgi:imidazole glycerol-phosphate synthase
MPTVHLLDYVAGNVRSLVNAIETLGWTVEWVTSPDQVKNVEVYIIKRSISGENINGDS